MRRQQRFGLPVAVATAVIDVLLINVAFALAWWSRYESNLGPEVAEFNYVTLDAYLPVQVALTVVLFFIFDLQGAYRRRLRADLVDQVGSIIAAVSIGIALMIIAVFYWREYALSRLMFGYAWLLIVLFLGVFRVAVAVLRSYRRRKGLGLLREVIVGAGGLGRMIMQAIVADPDCGLHVLGFVDDTREEDIGRFKALGKVDDLPAVMRDHWVEEVVIALPAASHQKITAILMHCARQKVGCRIVPDFYELTLRQVDIDPIGGIPLIGLREVSIRGWNLAVKRVVDIVVAGVVLVLAAPLMLAIAAAIKLDSPGPVLFRQVRLGRNRQRFVINKFRSMRVTAEAEQADLAALNEADGPIFKIRQDPRLTRVGRFLRRLSLDELPQFINVLSGDMSLVGPRPPIPREVERYEDWHHQRLEVAPGLTGLWQVSGRSELTFDEMVLLDIWYIENWNLGLDFKILLRTVPAVFFGNGAY